jgi:two-component system CheB/CheR fusion protein
MARFSGAFSRSMKSTQHHLPAPVWLTTNQATYAQLHTVIELHESATEELKSANEEYQSVNEELQSANEELETSKEEMQSINEELQIINAEAHSRNETLTRINSDLRNLMDSTLIATLFLDRDLCIGSYTPAMIELFHLRNGDRGRPITEISARINYPELKQDVAEVLRHLNVVERVLQGNANEPVYLLRIRPYRTIDNVIDGTVLTFVDITETLRHDIDRAQLAAIVDSSRDAVIGYTLDDEISSWNLSAERILGYSASQALGSPLSMLLPEDATKETKAIFARESENDRPNEFETVWKTKNGESIPVAVSNSPVRNAQGRRIAGALMARDISDRKGNEKRTQMMLGELNHRVKNTLAGIQAIALQSLAASPNLEDFRTSFLARLKSLSETHNLLSVEAWHGVKLLAVVRSELAPYQGVPGPIRVYIQGEDVTLSPKIALALSMALHELTTNAMKYGALSVPDGRIEIHWETRTAANLSRLHVQWQELRGPKVDAPTSRGFGTRLITDGLAFELDGEVALEFASTGVKCTIDLPLGEPHALI